MNTSNPFRIVVCASGGGGNFQALIDSRESLGIEISQLLVDRHCGAVQRAVSCGVAYTILENARNPSQLADDLDRLIPDCTDLIVLTGFMPIIPESICKKWPRKIINTHPSLLPKYGGRGMYGVRVQEAVMNAQEREAGCTVHYVNSDIDGGEIIMQESMVINYSDTPWQLGGRVFELENRLLIEAVRHLRAIVR
ncbi:MAG: phosphoribosylglycinamide formyltransferase [Candidatus Accumulibacter sp. UW20]|jgi:phosphoribosylglycinamide formyltransferase-1